MLLVVGDGHIIGIDRNHLYAVGAVQLSIFDRSNGLSFEVKRARRKRKQQQHRIEREGLLPRVDHDVQLRT
jgi:hypothetical protein